MVKSIEEIENLVSEIQKEIEEITFDNSKHFGSEEEYTHKGMIGGVKALLLDLVTLTKKPEKLLKYSTYEERTSMISTLTNIKSYLDDPPRLLIYIDMLKPLARQYNVRFSKDRYDEFNNQIDNLTRKEIDFTDFLSRLRESEDSYKTLITNLNDHDSHLDSETNKFETKFKKLTELQGSLNEKIEAITETIEEFDNTVETIEEKKKIIEDAELAVKTNQKVVDSFVSKISAKENQLETIQLKTDDYLKLLSDYKIEYNNILTESKGLIESAKLALNYKTAEGISASFQTQYEEERKKNPMNWIYAATTCLAVALGIGVWILLDKQSTLITIIGRITMIPIPLVGAYFCAKTYREREKIIQDYAYKMVLSKAIVGFSEQFKHKKEDTNDEYSAYVKRVLEEIHQDPLRRNVPKSSSDKKEEASQQPSTEQIDKVVSLIEKVMKLGK
jgi:DNA repair exonuclease SbcCD ATPase subunit